MVLCGQALAQSQDMDTELSALAEKLATQIQNHANKKVTVIDFTDLEGGSSELGKYIAEQLTVDLVMGKRDFSVLDRANLKSILAEHKLTAQGLVDPENAKKLGMFAGVDAIILGTIIPKDKNINLTAKIITTETAEIVGAARAEFTKTPEVGKLVSHPTPSSKDTDPAIENNSQQIDDLLIKVESVRLTSDGVNGYLQTTLFFKNTSGSSTLGIGLYSRSNVSPETKILNGRGDEFKLYYNNISGIPLVMYPQYLTDVKPGGSLIATLKFQTQWNGKSGNYGPYRLQATIMVGVEDQGRYGNLKNQNFVIEIPTVK
jgi:TolB-like protein